MASADTYRLSQTWPREAWTKLRAFAKGRGISMASAILYIVCERLDAEESRTGVTLAKV